MFCRKCGRELKDGELFCAGCGEPTQSQKEAEPAQQQPGSQALSRTTCVLNGVLALFLSIFYFMACRSVCTLLSAHFMGEMASESIASGVPLVFTIVLLLVLAVPCIVFSANKPNLLIAAGGGIALGLIILWVLVLRLVVALFHTPETIFSSVESFSRIAVPASLLLFFSLSLFSIRRKGALWELVFFGADLILSLILAFLFVVPIHLGVFGCGLAMLIPSALVLIVALVFALRSKKKN